MGEFRGRDVGIPCNVEAIYKHLLSLDDSKCDVDLPITIDDLRLRFDVLIAKILIERGQGGDTLADQFVAELAAGEDSMRLHHNLLDQLPFISVFVTAKSDGFDPVPQAAIHVVSEIDVGGLLLQVGGHFYAEIALTLKE